MKTSVILSDMRFYAFHGVMEQERQVGNWFSVSLRLEYPFGRALESDDVADTLNYAAVHEVVEREMKEPSKLIEHVAGRIHAAIMARFPEVAGGRLTVAKLKPPIAGTVAEAAVELEW